MLSLVLVFSIVAAKAQTVKEYKAQIPFAFSVGQKSYQAGDYVIKVSKFSVSSVALSLEDNEKNVLQTIFAQGNGNIAKAEPKLLFNRNGDQLTLSNMTMPEMGLSIAGSNDKKQAGKESGRPTAKIQGVAVASKE